MNRVLPANIEDALLGEISAWFAAGSIGFATGEEGGFVCCADVGSAGIFGRVDGYAFDTEGFAGADLVN